MSTKDHLRRDTHDLGWTATGSVGVERKLLSPPDDQDAACTSLLRLTPGATWSPPDGVAVLVVRGDWSSARGRLGPGGYGRLPAGSGEVTSSAAGCSLFVKAYAPGVPGADLPALHVPSAEQPWLPGHGGLRVKPLAAEERHGAALVLWPAGERFVRHQHWGGEEILVLSGTFRDEHGSYPTGTWLRSPHLSVHFPFVEEETVIFVRTGHLATDFD
ncbi:MAG: cupin domain-containing protein [Planctomycetota bacterium]|nr:cupin domain-containing protein [Planctomycetota bacterium]